MRFPGARVYSSGSYPAYDFAHMRPTGVVFTVLAPTSAWRFSLMRHPGARVYSATSYAKPRSFRVYRPKSSPCLAFSTPATPGLVLTL